MVFIEYGDWWRVIGGMLVCERFRFVVRVKGERRELESVSVSTYEEIRDD